MDRIASWRACEHDILGARFGANIRGDRGGGGNASCGDHLGLGNLLRDQECVFDIFLDGQEYRRRGGRAGPWAQALAHGGGTDKAHGLGGECRTVLAFGDHHWRSASDLAHIARARGAVHGHPAWRFAKAEIQKFGNLGIARGSGLTAEDGCNDPFATAFCTGHKIEARRAGIAGFDPIGAAIVFKHAAVGMADRTHAGIGGDTREQIVILRIVVKQAAPQKGHVMGGR